MIGVYDYTVVLTYLSMISGATGIILTMTGIGHPYLGALFLMFSGLFDSFDGKVARTKKNRSELEKNFGVQIDSLSDLICFGVLPAAIGLAQLRISGRFIELMSKEQNSNSAVATILMIAVADIYILTALIRLAYFNATEDERQKEAAQTGVVHYTGLPVTSAALIFPFTLIIHYFVKADLTVIYFWVMFITAILFVGTFKIPKLSNKVLYILVGFGLLELFGLIFIILD